MQKLRCTTWLGRVIALQGLLGLVSKMSLLMQKVNVNGPAADPVFKLAKSAFPGDISWNFAGIFIFDKNGKPVGRFSARELSKVEATLDALVTDKEL